MQQNNKNNKKYLSYKEAYSRMNNAIISGFYLEAITIQESIISDRILSFVIGKNLLSISENELHKNKAGFGNLLNKARSFMSDYDSLADELFEFKNSRNKCVHLLVKSFPGKPTIDVTDFITLAMNTSNNGKKLTRRVIKWHNAEKKKAYK